MKYQNATEVLPQKLIEEIQKYTSGTLIYIPNGNVTKTWGEVSGYRSYLIKRNQMIKNHFNYGNTIDELSNEYCLSIETIKKVVYSKKNSVALFEPTTESANQYSDVGLLEEWVHTYLIYERKNIGFSIGLYEIQRYYIGPITMPVNLFTRCSGPEATMKWVVHEEVFERKSQEWVTKIIAKDSIPPLIINYTDMQFEVNCNNPLLEALFRLKQENHPIIFWFSSKQDYDSFQTIYHFG